MSITASPYIIERVTHKRWSDPPTDYSQGVKARWDAIAPLYTLQRTKEPGPVGKVVGIRARGR
jgi:hypothetical protein